MKHIFLAITLILGPWLLTAAAPLARAAKPPVAVTPAEAIVHFFSALMDDDIDAAIAMSLPLKNVPMEAAREEYQELADFAKRNGRPSILAHLRLGDAAVVLFREAGPGKERAIDIDPAYLVLHDRRWHVVFELTEFDGAFHELGDATLDRLEKLQTWYESQKPVVQGLLRAEDEEKPMR